MLNAYIYDGVRSAFGRHGGVLSALRPDDLAAQVIVSLLARNRIDVAQIEDVILGCTNQAGEDARNVARHAALAAGLPVTVPGQTVNRLCASGLAAVIAAAHAVHAGEGDWYVAGGVESMSRAPFVLGKAATAFSRDVQMFDSTLGARFPNPAITAVHGADTMPETGDNVARACGISRLEADGFALASQQKYAAALARGFFADEIVGVDVPVRRGERAIVSVDEGPRPATTAETLARLKPVAENGVVTAGNASGLNDGAAALLIGSLQAGERGGRAPLARIVSSAVTGVAPRLMGLGPVTAIHKALERAGLTLADMDLIEINEAFASQVLGCLSQLGLAPGDTRINPNGGAIALGHPLGASGARLVLSAARELKQRGARYAVVSLCIGLGQGLAVVIERPNE